MQPSKREIRKKLRLPPVLAAAALWVFALAGTGCPGVHVSHPVVPPSDDQPDPSAGYFTHFVQLTWAGNDLTALNSMAITHPAEIEVRSDPNIPSLSLTFAIDIQKDHHDDLANDYEAEVHRNSVLAGSDPKLVFPERTCQEANRAVTGMCVRRLTVLVPAGKRFALELTWKNDLRVENAALTQLTLHVPAAGSARVLNTSASLSLSGGGPLSNLIVDQLAASAPASVAGDCVAHLDAIGNLILNRVPGRILLYVNHPEQSHVLVDGSAITQFPYQHP